MPVVEINTSANPAFVNVPSGGGGASQFNVTAVQIALYNAAVNDLVRVDPSGGGFTVNLPVGAAGDAGKEIIVKNVSDSANAVAVAPQGGQTVDGNLLGDSIASGRTSRTYVFDGVSDWMIV